ncbi:MAG: outer membrane beta-barrel protein [Bacteroidaceae bacterium]|nr:outer membrane beta-barrel protein [Bacteroidaceae bacterium]
MKKTILGLLLALCTLSANAQFEAGKKYVNTSLSGLNLSYSKNTKFCFNLDATGGYFLADDWMVMGRLGYAHPGRHQDKFELGLGGRYYIEQNGLSLGALISYEHGHNYNWKTDNWFITPEIGYTFFLNQYLTIEPALYYKMSLNDFSDASTVGLRIGLGWYF